MVEQRPTGTRVSLACAQCRARHSRCDAKKPSCSRCLLIQQDCNYPSSKRGGPTRAMLAAYRARKEAINGSTEGPSENSSDGAPAVNAKESTQEPETQSIDSTAGVSPSHTSGASAATPALRSQLALSDFEWSDISNDAFVKVYFKCFHRYHPYVLPLQLLRQYFDDAAFHAQLLPVVAVIRFIGSIYARAYSSSKLREEADRAIATARRDTPRSPFLAQALMLHSIALFWSQEEANSRQDIDSALQIATLIGMNRREFAAENAPNDPLLQECFRRTWWQIYIVDASYASIERSPTFGANNVSSDVDMPCGEEEYESNRIPDPSTLADFDVREFEHELKVYSSFAYLIGIIRALAQVSSMMVWQSDGCPSVEGVSAIDSAVDGWLLLLPASKQQVLQSNGEVDELLFYAKMWIYATLTCSHRALSDIAVNPLENLSSCVGPTQTNELPTQFKRVHTARCLASIQQQVDLLALPKRPFCHSPFVICMVVVGTLPYLSACAGLLQGRELLVARQQIRLIIGCLKAMGDVWKKGQSRVEELQAIGKEIIRGPSLPPASGDGNANAASTPGVTSYYLQCPLSQALFSTDMIPSVMSTDTPMQLWPAINPQLDISTWITDSFGTL